MAHRFARRRGLMWEPAGDKIANYSSARAEEQPEVDSGLCRPSKLAYKVTNKSIQISFALGRSQMDGLRNKALCWAPGRARSKLSMAQIRAINFVRAAGLLSSRLHFRIPAGRISLEPIKVGVSRARPDASNQQSVEGMSQVSSAVCEIGDLR